MVFETGHLVAMSNHLGRAETVGATTCNDLQRPRVAAFFHSAHDQAPQVLQGSSSKMRAEKCSRDYRFQEHLTTRRNMESTYLMCIATLQSFAKNNNIYFAYWMELQKLVFCIYPSHLQIFVKYFYPVAPTIYQ